MIPQIIYIVLLIIELTETAKNHGKLKEGKYNALKDLIGVAITIALLWWGGFFDPLMN